MKKVKITVMKITTYEDLMEKYENPIEHACNMKVVRKVIQDELHVDIPIAGLAKDDRHRTNELLFGFPPKVVGLKPNSEVFRLLAHIQDEVHRFAIAFHRKKFEKGFIHSELADIKGIGKKTAEKLLLELKSVKGIKEASLERLAEIVGPAKAEIVYNHLVAQKKPA